MQDDPRNYTVEPPGRLTVIGWIGAALAVVALTAALVLARDLGLRRAATQREEELAQGRRVLVQPVSYAPPSRTVEVPATIHGFIETPIYAKIAGYLQTVAVDKGDRVRQGQVLARLESPELDQQVANARANYELQDRTDRRTQELLSRGVVAQQDADQSHAALLQGKATLEQLEAMQAYKIIRAPFNGIITARFVDPGALVPAATSSAPSQPLLAMATLQPLRVYADVPQSVAPFIQNGDPATVTVTEYSARRFTGSVTRHPEALAAATRTMQVEVDLDNADLALYPGMYAAVTFQIAMPAGAPLVPDDALVFRDGKVYVPIVRDNRLHLAEVALGHDDGERVEITKGIARDDLVAIDVGQAVRDGEPVQPVREPAGG